MSNFIAKITLTAIDKVSAVTKSIGTSLDRLKLRTASLGQSFSTLGAASGQFGARLRNVALAATAVAGGIFAMTKRTADMGENLLNAAQRAGVTVEELQKLRYAAELSGIDIGDMDNALKFLNKSIAEASTNSKSDAAAAFRSLKISVKDSNGELKSASQIFVEMADKFQKNEDGAKKVATAFGLMSRSGTTLIPLLNQGSKSFRDLGAEADRLGIILTKEQAEALDNYGDNVQRAQKSLVGLTNSITVALVPALNDIAKGVLEYITANKELLAQNITKFIKDFGDGLRALWRTIKLVVDIVSPFVSALGGIKTIVVALASIYLAGLVISFAKLVIAIGGVTKAFALMSITFFASPIGWVTAGLAALLAAGYLLYRFWPQLSAAFSGAWGTIKEIAVTVFEAFKRGIQSLKVMLLAFVEVVSIPFKGLINILNRVAETITGVKNVFGSVKAPNLAVNTTPNSVLPLAQQQQTDQTLGLTNPVLANPLTQSPFSTNSQPSIAPVNGLGQSVNNQPNAAPVGRLGQIAQPQPQKLDINMKIDAEGRPKEVTAKSKAPIDFTANTGVMVP